MKNKEVYEKLEKEFEKEPALFVQMLFGIKKEKEISNSSWYEPDKKDTDFWTIKHLELINKITVTNPKIL